MASLTEAELQLLKEEVLAVLESELDPRCFISQGIDSWQIIRGMEGEDADDDH